ncbi:MAG: trigger factor [Gammaproteobacteria bacterium]|nr:trigger factor [Gammaproteobacteria bacterium]
MAVSIDNLGGIQRKVELVVSIESIRQEVQKRLQDLVGKVRIDGFRRGKVPVKIIQERYGDSVYAEALNELINHVYSAALKESNIVPAGAPKITPLNDAFKKDEDFKFTAVFEVFPEITLQPFSGLTIEKCVATLEESDVEKAIERVREQRATKAENGDKQLPELNEDFVASLGVKGGLEEFSSEVRKNLERELKYALKNKLKANVIEQLVSAHPFDVPDALVMQEAERLRENSKRYFKQMGSKINFPEVPLDVFKEKALKNVRVGLLFSEMFEKLKIEATQDKIDERVRDMATMYDDAEGAIQWISHDKRQMENIRAQVAEDALIEKVLEEANIVEKTVTYEELIQQGRT